MSLKPVLCLAALSALVIALAAPARAAKPVKNIPVSPRTASPVSATDGTVGLVLGMDKNTYVVAAAPAPPMQIHAVLTFFNHSHTPLHLSLRGASTEWQVLDAQGHVVWDYAVGRAIPHNIRLVTLTNSQLRYTQDIPLQTQDGASLAPGRYTLRGALLGAMGASASLDFTITR